VSRCTWPYCRGTMLSEPDEPYPVCQLCGRTGYEAEANERARACSEPGCLRDSILGHSLCGECRTAARWYARDAARPGRPRKVAADG
jgi:hypothetical protein